MEASFTEAFNEHHNIARLTASGDHPKQRQTLIRRYWGRRSPMTPLNAKRATLARKLQSQSQRSRHGSTMVVKAGRQLRALCVTPF